MPGLKNIYPFGEALHVVFDKRKKGIEEIQEVLNRHYVPFQSMKKITPSFEDVFLALVRGQREIQAKSSDECH